MQDVFNILRQIEANSSRNTKKEILRKYQDNELLKKYFLYAYDERRVFGIGSKSIRKPSKTAQSQTTGLFQNSLFGNKTSNSGYDNIFDLLEELTMHPFGSGDDVKAVNDFLSKQDEEAFDWYRRLILKDLKIGCTATTVNEVYDNYIPTFDVMLAHPYNQHADKITGLFQLQRKIDGFRLVTYHHPDGSLQFFTRNGLELFNFPDIEADFKNIAPKPCTMIFDGECIAKDTFNDTQKLIMRKEAKTNVVYHVFDLTTIDEWEREESFDKLFTRYDLLSTVVPSDLDYIKVVEELYRGDDLEQITHWFDIAKHRGWEGIMVKMNATYVRKRTTNMLKVKEFDTLDLRVLRVNEGSEGSDLEGTMGSVTVDFEGQEVNVGSGFNLSDRARFWENPNLIVDRVIEVQYFEKTTNESGKPSLRFPVFKQIREDK